MVNRIKQKLQTRLDIENGFNPEERNEWRINRHTDKPGVYFDPATAILIMASISAGVSYSQNKKAQASAGKANDKQTNAQEAADAEMRRQRVREARVKRAQIIQVAGGAGVAASSGVGGAVSSLDTQVGSSVAFQAGQQQAAEIIGGYQQDATDHASKSQVAGQVGSLALSAYTQTDQFKSLFKP